MWYAPACLAAALLAASNWAAPARAQQLPTGGSVAAGSATISSPNASTLNINQSTNRAIINWQGFSVGTGGTVNFNQPGASSATLNRVLGSTPSTIAGTINAPGTVLLVNPNGIAITRSGVVNVGSFAASTLDIKNEDFLAGNYKFMGSGSSARVVNNGRINVSDGGFAALLGGQVANNGVISARLGKVALGSGELITLDLAGDGFLSVAVPSNQIGSIRDGNGRALVTNRGKIRADGGSVYLSAATATSILRDAVNVPGSIRANSVGSQNGRIFIGGGAGGNVKVGGRLQAKGGEVKVSGKSVDISGKVNVSAAKGGTISAIAADDLRLSGQLLAVGYEGAGGRIDLTANNVAIVGALIDASGATGGGLVRIGGTFQGGNSDPNDPLHQSFVGRFGVLPDIKSAQVVFVDAGSKIDVSATSTGHAGSAIVWSEQATGFAGTIAGTGATGNGGFAEVSSHGVLDFEGAVSLLGANNTPGTLLLDPRNVTIVAGTGGTISGGVYTPTVDNSTVGATTIQNALATANVTITTGTTGMQAGDITLSTNITWAGTGTNGNFALTLNAAGSIILNGNIVANKTNGSRTNNTITLIAGLDITVGSGRTVSTTSTTTGAAVTMTAGRDITVNGTLTANSATGSVATAINLNATRDLTFNGTTNTNAATGSAVALTAGRDVSFGGTINATNVAGNAVTITAARNIALSGFIDAASGLVTLSAGSNANPGATITETSGTGIWADRLLLTTGATALADAPVVTLGYGANFNSGTSVRSTIAGRVGSLDYYAFQGFGTTTNVGTIGSTVGLTANGDVRIWTSNGTLGSTAAITSGGNISLLSGGYTFNGGISAAGTLDIYGSGDPSFPLLATFGSSAAVSANQINLWIGLAWVQVGPLANLVTNNAIYVDSGSTFLRATGGVGSSANPYVIADVYGLQGIGTLPTSNHYKLGNNIDASQTATWNGGAGFLPIGTDNSGTVFGSFGGTFDGAGFTISGLTINRPTMFYVGLFQDIESNASVTNLTLTGLNIRGDFIVGGLSGHNYGTVSGVTTSGTVVALSGSGGGLLGVNRGTVTGSSAAVAVSGDPYASELGGLVGANYDTITNSSASGNVAGFSNLGGLVGRNTSTGSITGSSASGDVSAPYVAGIYSRTGGLVGWNVGAIDSSFATGDVNGALPDAGNPYNGGNWAFGGLVGLNGGTISNSYATGNVTGLNAVGGLVGSNGDEFSNMAPRAGTITNSYHTIGTVTGNSSVGGLVGENRVGSTITDSRASGTVVGVIGDPPTNFMTSTGIGGLVGENFSGEIARSYATGAVSGDSYVGGLVGYNYGSLHEVYAIGNVTGTGERIGGLVGQNDGSIVNAYATGNVSGLLNVGGLVGLLDSGGNVSSAYSTGAVTYTLFQGGALLGSFVNGTLANVYWNSESTLNGSPAGANGFGSDGGNDTSGAQGLTTAQLQAQLPNGFSTSFWGIVPNSSYPFLLFQPGVVSGTVYSTYGGTTQSGVSVFELVNGSGSGFAVTNGSGQFTFFLPQLAGGGDLLLYTNNGATYRQNVSGAIVVDIYGGYLTQTTSMGSASALAAGLAAASNPAAQAVIATLNSRIYNLTGGSFVVDQAISATNLVMSTAGTVSQTAPVTATNLLLTGTGTYTLTNTGNQVGTVAANTGSMSLTNLTPLAVNAVLGVNGITATGNVTLTADQITLTAVTGTITAGQVVTLAPYTAGTTIFVGSGASGFVVTSAAMALITADTLAIGNTLSGALTVNQSIAPNVSNLALVSGSTVTQTGGVINVGGLGIQGTTATMLGTTTATRFASSTTSAPTINFAGDLTIATIGPIDGITWTDGTSATIRATGNITVAGSIKNTGGGSLILYADSAANGVGAITFINGARIDFGSNSGNVTLYEHRPDYPNFSDFGNDVVMGGGRYTQYNLIDTPADLQAINNNLYPNTNGLTFGYALNRNLDMSGFGNFSPIADGVSSAFDLVFEGQNYSISNLSITSSAGRVGLFGAIGQYGVVRNLRLANVSVNATGLDDGQGFGPYVGALAGQSSGSISNIEISGSVASTNINAAQPTAGGVVGYINGGPTLDHVYSYASVTVASTNVGFVGGLIGYLYEASNLMVFNQLYATGAVSAPNNVNTFLGGLIGTTAWVQASQFTNVYWDMSTTGAGASFAAGDFSLSTINGGRTTAALQGVLPSGFDSTWSTGTGLYPYLTAFYPVAPQVISGLAYSDRGVTPLNGSSVNVVANGTAIASTTAGASGYYYILLPGGTLTGGTEIVAYTTGGSAGVTYQPGAAASLSNFNISGGYLTAVTSATALSSVPAVVGDATVQTIVAGLSNVEYVLSAANFSIDQALALTSKVLVLNTAGTVTQSAAISVTGAGSGLLLLGSGSTYTLTNSGNNVSTLAATTGTLNLNNGANALTIDTVAGTTGITATNLYLTNSNSVTSIVRIAATNVLLNGGGSYSLLSGTNAINNVAGNAGAVSIQNTSGTLAITTVNGVVGLTASGAVALTANAMSMAAALNAAGQTVTLRGNASGTAIGLGTGAGTLSLTQASLNNIAAANLVIGGSGLNPIITVGGSVTMPAGVANLTLITTAAISIATGNSLTNNNANGSITLQTNTSPTLTGTLVANSATGTVNIFAGGTATIGLGTGAQNIALTQARLNQITAANLVIGSPTMTVGITLTSASGAPITLNNVTNLTLRTAGTINFSSATTSLVLPTNSGTITLLTNTSPTFTVGSMLRATGTNSIVTIAGLADSTTIRLGSGTGGNIGLTQANLNAITASTLVVGRSNSTGTITVNGTGIALGASITNLTLATGSTITVSASAPLSNANANGVLTLQGLGGLTLGAAVSANSSTGTLVLNTGANATQTAAITAARLRLLGGGAFTLTTAANSVVALAGSVGSLNYSQNASLSLDTVAGTSGVTSAGAVTIATGGNLTIASGNIVTGTQVVLSAIGNFINSQGSNAVAASTRWLIYSNNPASNNFNSLNSGNTAIWNSTMASLLPANVNDPGNRYIFAFQPTATFTSLDATKTYGDVGSLSAFDVSVPAGVANAYLADTPSSIYSGTPALTSPGTDGAAGIGLYNITIATGTLTSTRGYAFAFSSTGRLTVGQRSITVTADSGQSRLYGDNNPVWTFTTSSLGAGAALNGALMTGATLLDGVGTYAIDQGTLTNANNPNYLIAYTSANMSILARPLTVTGTTINRVYGDNNPATTTNFTAPVGSAGSGSGLVNGDTIGSVVVNSAANGGSDVGIYAFTPSGAAFTSGTSGNYQITYAAGTLNVTQRPVTVTADAKSRPYGDANPALTFSTTNLGLGAAIAGSLATTATPSSSVGPYAITQGTVDAANNPNYAITYVGADLTVGQRPVTVTADTLSRPYGDANPALTFTTTSLGAGAPVAGTLTTTATPSSNIGNYAIAQGTVDAANNPNYAITYVGANLTIGQRSVTVTADPQARPYGDANPPLTFTTTSLGAGVPILGSLETTAVPSSNVGLYAITQGTVDAANNTNYAITYVGANLAVTPRAVTVTADAQTRLYGDPNPAFTFTTTSLGAGAPIAGTLTTVAILSSDVGAYGITQGTVNGANNANYAITYVGANLAVTPRPLTVTGESFGRVYGDNNPATTTAFTAPNGSAGSGSGLVNGDTIGAVAVNTPANQGSDVGAYSFLPGNATFGTGSSGNYQITYQPGTLNVTQAPLTFTAASASRSAGESNPALSGAINGFKNGQSAATFGGDTWTTEADTNSAVGQYPIIGGLVLVSPNYLIIQAAGNATALSINPANTLSGENPSNVNVPPPANNAGNNTTITFQTNTTTPTVTPISFTPPTGGTNIVTGVGQTAGARTVNNGLDFKPISQFDRNQYSQFELPAYAPNAGQAAIFTMIARAVAPDQAASIMIDMFWNGAAVDWNGVNGSNPVKEKVTFSDGQGNNSIPDGTNGLPIAAGTTDFALMLGQGPVMIGGSNGKWMLAIAVSADGKGIVANDPETGSQVILSFDPATKTVGGVTATFNAESNSFVPVSNAGTGVSDAQSFVPANFFAVTIQK